MSRSNSLKALPGMAATPGAVRPGLMPSYLSIHRGDPIERIKWIKDGIGARYVKALFGDLNVTQAEGLAALNLHRATLDRKAAADETLPPAESERVIGLASLIGQVQAMVEESGDAQGFSAPTWLSRWLREPLGAFGGQPPIAFMDTITGQELVSRTLAQIQSGAYA